MAMKTVLVPVPVNGPIIPVLETAHLFASKYDAYMEGVVWEFFTSDFVAVDGFGGGWVPPAKSPPDNLVQECRQAFEAFMARKSVPASDGFMNRLSYKWSDETKLLQSSIGEHSRIFDITVFGSPSAKAHPMQQVALETTLFESGRPILVTPPDAPKKLGDTILVAWNGSTKSALTTALAMPLLEKAKRVIVLTVEGGMVPGPSGGELARHLRANGVPAEDRAVPQGGLSTGERILAETASLGCDLVVKGAYTQSRLRQMIFGGATRHILQSSQVPVFMAH